MKVSVIIPSAGIGKRLGNTIPKQYIEIDGIPIIIRTMLVFQRVDAVDSIVLSINPDWKEYITEQAKYHGISKPIYFVEGGSERQHSVFNALISEYLEDIDTVLIHDAVRPFVTDQLIEQIIHATALYQAVIPALTPKETIKRVKEDIVDETLNRSELISVQTPQGFNKNLLIEAYTKAMKSDFSGTDDASFVEKFTNTQVHIIEGLETNIKITTTFDLILSELIIPDYNK